MKEKTRMVFDRLETQRSRIIEEYGRLTSEQLRYKPVPDQWNLLQVLRHLITAEQQSLMYIQRKMKMHENIPKAGLGSSVRHLLLKIALYLPIKFKAPKIAAVHEEYPDFEQMKSEWAGVRSELLTLIEVSDSKMLTKALYKHPRAGLLNMKQALEFFESHITHHQKQIDRLIADQ
ncbi:hypothetical protein BH23BAC3_BH23BAC3_15850 [soil metagenome]